MEPQEHFKMSDSIVNLLKSLAKFHAEVETIAKTSDNPFFHSVYAPLETILPAIDGPLQTAGLEVIQIPHGDSVLTTIVADVLTGEYMRGTLILNPVDKKPQSQGSAITYARRYMIVSMLKLNTDKDDDGNEANGNGAKKPRKAVKETNPHVDEFMEDLRLSEEDIIKYQEKLESARDLKELRKLWESLPPMAQEQLEGTKEKLKTILK